MRNPEQSNFLRIALITLGSVLASLAISGVVFYLAAGEILPAAGWFTAVVAPLLIAPSVSYSLLTMQARLHEANDKLRILSETDPLTRVYNRRRFLQDAEHHLALAARQQLPTSLLLIDFDHFKQVNDRHGHAVGDQVLQTAVLLMMGTLRGTDVLARFGGEEFVVLLPHTPLEGALLTAQRLRAAVDGHDFGRNEEPLRVSVSVGGVTCETSQTPLTQLTSAADNQLYAGKRAGRNCVRVSAVRRNPVGPEPGSGTPAPAEREELSGLKP